MGERGLNLEKTNFNIYIIVYNYNLSVLCQKIVRVLTNIARPEGECTMCQNPLYYFGLAHSNCNTIIIVMLTAY